MHTFTSQTSTRRAAALLALTSLLVPVVAHAAAAHAPVKTTNVIVVQSKQFQVTLPPAVQSGPVTLRWIDNGGIWQGVTLGLLKPGATVSRFVAAEKSQNEQVLTALTIPYGGMGGPADRQLMVTLPPGRYVLYDQETGAKKKSLVAAKSFVVTGTAQSSLPAPTPSATVTMSDFKYKMPGHLSVGLNVLELRNVGKQNHMMIVLKANPGITYKAIVTLLKKAGPNGPSGPPPGTFVGGGSDMAPGQTAYLTENFKPGLYVALCFEMDPKTHLPHYLRGMIHAIHVG